jgi:hypothetical protein
VLPKHALELRREGSQGGSRPLVARVRLELDPQAVEAFERVLEQEALSRERTAKAASRPSLERASASSIQAWKVASLARAFQGIQRQTSGSAAAV